MKNFSSSLFLLAALFCLNACVKNEVGPQGPKGAPGDPALANIKTLIFTSQAFSTNPLDSNLHQVNIDIPEMSDTVISRGFFQAFAAPDSSNKTTWTALPGLFSPDPGSVPFVHLNYQITTGKLAIYTLQKPEFEAIDVKVVLGN